MAAAIALLALAPGAANAESERRQAPDWAFGSKVGEGVLMAACSATLFSWFLPQRFNAVWKPLDAVPYEPVWDSLSDLTGSVIGVTLQIANGYAFEAAYLDRSAVPTPYDRALRVPLIDGEASLLTTGVIIAFKRISGRCRPRAFKDGKCLPTRSAHEGFPSGHTGPIAAIAGVHLTLALRTEHGPIGYRYAPFAIAEAGAIGTAVLRVVSGAHDISDVLIGWGLGHTLGALISIVHPMEEVTAPADTGSALRAPAGAPMLTWSGAF